MVLADRVKAGWFAGLATCLVFTELSIVRASFFRSDGPLPWAVAFDLLCVLPGAYVLFVLRPAARPAHEALPLVLFGAACAGVLLRKVPSIQLPLHLFAAAAEVVVFVALGSRIVRTLRGASRSHADLVLLAQQQAGLLARIVAFELCVLFSACIAPFKRPRAVANEILVFRNQTKPQQLLLALGLISVLEAVPMHFLLHAWKPLVAWVVLGLTLYSMLWIVGACQAFSHRPILVSDEHVLLRVCFFYTVELPRSTIRRVVRYSAHESQPDVVALKVAVSPNLAIELSEPARVYGPLGRVRVATRLAVYVEAPDELARVLSCDTRALAES